MATYTKEQKEELVAAAERLGVFDTPNKKVVRLKKQTSKVHNQGEPVAQRKKLRETRAEMHARMLAKYQIKPLQKDENIAPYDVTNPTRYQAVVAWDAGSIAQKNILEKYQFSMREQGILPGDLRRWREYYLLMSRSQLAKIVRVCERTIRLWETGKSAIPFSMWWMMHSTLQDPAYFLTRPGFHDFYIEYENGEAILCSSSYPDIRYSAADLYFNRAAFNEALRCQTKLQEAESQYAELLAENTRLREMYKTNAVTKELENMHQHIGQLMARLNTADVVSFPVAPRLEKLLDSLKKTA